MSKLARARTAEAQRAAGDAIRQMVERFKPPGGWKEPPPDPNRCTDCDNTGWVQTGNGVTKCTACLSKARGQAPGVPVEEHGAFLDTFTENADNRDAVKQARLWLDGVHPDLYLQGGVGTGKTKLACALLNEQWRRGQRVEFMRVALLLTTLLPGADDMDETIERVSAVPILVLDDVGASQATDFARRMLLVIYEARGDRGHRTIWTSNLDLGDLSEFTQDDRLPSRIAGRAKVVELGGKDWRLRKVRK